MRLILQKISDKNFKIELYHTTRDLKAFGVVINHKCIPRVIGCLEVHFFPFTFTRAHAVLEAFYEKQLQEVDPDYYLFAFTDAELLDILSKPDEWGHFDYSGVKLLSHHNGLFRTVNLDVSDKRPIPIRWDICCII